MRLWVRNQESEQLDERRVAGSQPHNEHMFTGATGKLEVGAVAAPTVRLLEDRVRLGATGNHISSGARPLDVEVHGAREAPKVNLWSTHACRLMGTTNDSERPGSTISS